MPGPGVADQPSFDCAKAASDAEDAICASAALGALDRELTRIYGLAANGPNMTGDRLSELKAFQRGWIKGRDECWKSSLGVEECVLQEYALRIGEIRTQYADARSEAGLSDGPFPYVCDGLDIPLSAVFISGEDPLLSLTWRDGFAVMRAQPAASGIKYSDGAFTFWAKGDEAVFTASDGQDLSCERDAMN
ncbi:MAG: DUF1311 domain-containing protein [Rhodobacteraceae bacterium]|nr:DUF1311 domain-containing protein [Paracoccaceae bacterium]